MSKNDYFVIIPAHNEEKRLERVVREVKKAGFKNIVIVDDGSSDNTFKKAKSLNTILLRHKINLGKGAALKTGCKKAFQKGAKAVILMDSDGQHKASDISKFVKKLEEGYEVIFGSRNFYMGVPAVRYLGNKFGSVLVSLLFGIYVSDLLCGYRALTKKAFEKMNWESMGYGVETEMAVLTAKRRLSHCEVSVKAIYYDKDKGVTLLDAIEIFFSTLKWRITK